MNFIRPYESTVIGWDFVDVHLDLIVSAEGVVRTKDEDELEAAIARGEVTREDGDAAYRRLDQLVTDAEAERGVFGDPWPEWRPAESWPHPALSDKAVAKLQRSPTPCNFELRRDWWLGTG